MYSSIFLLALCCLHASGFRRSLRPTETEHIGKNYQFLTTKSEEYVEDQITAGENSEWDVLLDDDQFNSSVPLAMQFLLEEIEDEMWHGIKTSGEDFTPIATSLAPESIAEGIHPGIVVINFTIPNEFGKEFDDEPMTWLVLTLNNLTQDRRLPVVLKLYDGPKPRGDFFVNSTTVDWDKKFLVFNVTKYVNGSSKNQSLSFSLIVQHSGHPSMRTPVLIKDILELTGSGKGPILVSTAYPELSGMDMTSALRRRSRRTKRNGDATSHQSELTGSSTSSSATTSSSMTSSSSSSSSATPMISSSSNGCRLQEWTPSKDELGWDWLIRPVNVPINFCTGICPSPLLSSHFNASANAIARDYYRTIIKAHDSSLNHPSVHCVPIRYRPVTVLVESSPGVVKIEIVSKLAASQCGCR